MEGDILIKSQAQGGIEILLREKKYSHRDDARGRRQFYNQETHIHVGITNENVLENLINRRQRPYTTWKKELLPLVAKLIFEETGLIMGSSISWNQRLGCSCPCSPGFKTSLYDEEGRTSAYTVWITI